MAPLVGREQELELLTELLDALRAAAPGAALQVAGEPGIGKSRLLRELIASARDRGLFVLEGRAAEFEGELPFGIFRDALGDWLQALSPRRRTHLVNEGGAELAVVFPAFAEGLGVEAPAEIQQERYRAHRAVRRLLSAVAADMPLALVLDDIHWADPGSVELLCHLLAHALPTGVLIAVGFRPAQLDERLERALDAAARQDAVRVDLEPLDVGAATELLGAGVPAGVRERCYQQSGGNPFLLLELARGAASRTVPATLRAALASELSAVPPEARVLLQGAAVSGDPFDRSLAADAADLGDDESLVALDELLRSGLVSATEIPGQYSFRHPIIRATVYESAPSSWRVKAHARLAASLRRGGAGPAEQAPHVERSARRGDAAAVAVLSAAGDASERRAPALAARWYAAALRLLPDADDMQPRRIELMLALATVLSGAGRLSEAETVLGQVLDRLPDADPGRVGIVASCASVENLLGRHRDADARLRVAQRAATAGSRGAVALGLELAATAGFQNRAREMVEWAELALYEATRSGPPAVAAAAAGQLALARYFLGLPALQAADRASAALDALDDAELATRLDLGLWVGWTEAVLERHEQAIAHCQRVLDVSRQTGQGATLLVTMTAQAWAQARAGLLSDAEATLAEAIEVGRLAPHLFFAVALGLRAQLATCRGDYDAAVRAGREGVELARSADPGLIRGMAGLYMAMPLIELGQAREAREVLLEMSGGDGGLATSRSGHAAAFELLTRAEVALGDVDGAERWARRAQLAIHGGELRAEAAFAHRATAIVALARGDAERSARIALDAAAAAAGHAPIEAARFRTLAGTALARADERGPAIAALEQAAGELGRVGGDGYRAQAERELRRMGHRGTRRVPVRPVSSAAGLDALTQRERQLADAVAQGLTNRQIAASVFVSEKTVERHLSTVFRKLTVPNRAGLARLVAAQAAPAEEQPRAPVGPVTS